MGSPFGFVILIVLSLILIIPFGIALIYFGLAIWQLMTGVKEGSRWRRKGGGVAFVISVIAIVAIASLWWWIWVIFL
jgi:uncharacterized membrane protein YidH (DUF202 family)